MPGRNAIAAFLVAFLGTSPALAQNVAWPAFGPLRNLLTFEGYTDTLPDFAGPLDGSAELTIFTEGNHFPVLLPLALERFPNWCRANHACEADASRILAVTLPQPMIVRILKDGGARLGNAVLPVGADKPIFPDLIMGGTAPLKQLHDAGIVGPRAQVFARSRGMAMLLPRKFIVHDIDEFAERVGRMILASPGEPGAREQYRASLQAMIGKERTARLFGREVTAFPGRLGIQHRDVPYALLNGLADGGLIVRHLARFYAEAFPDLLRAIDVAGAERFGQEIGVVETERARRHPLAAAFRRFLMEAAQSAYPDGGFAVLGPDVFGRSLDL